MRMKVRIERNFKCGGSCNLTVREMPNSKNVCNSMYGKIFEFSYFRQGDFEEFSVVERVYVGKYQ